MSASIYYSASRAQPLNQEEHEAINRIVQEYSVDEQIEKYLETGDGPNWESFCIYDAEDASQDTEIFAGATQLPNNSEKNIIMGVQHWCKALSEIRKILHDAEWCVNIEDNEIPWNERLQSYDPGIQVK